MDSSTSSRLSSFLSSDSVSFSHLSANFPHLPSKPTFRSADEMLPKKANEILSNPEQGICFREIDEGLASRLHVSNLPFIFREPHLARLFSSYGTVVDAQVVTNEKGSKGFGFVSMSNSEEAAMARRMLHGTVVEGRRIEVNPATPKVRMGARLPITAVLQNYPSQMLELVEAQTRLAEAQVIFICIETSRINCAISVGCASDAEQYPQPPGDFEDSLIIVLINPSVLLRVGENTPEA